MDAPGKQQRRRSPKAKAIKAAGRSLAWLRAQGFMAEKCEQYIARVEGRGAQARNLGFGFRRDLFGFADILAFSRTRTVLVQATSRKQMAAHVRSYRKSPAIREAVAKWLAAPGRAFELHGWECVTLPTKAGGTKRRWQLTVRVIDPPDLVPKE